MRPEYPIRVISAFPKETIQSTRYYWENAERVREGYCTLQYTLSGKGVFEYQGVRHEIGKGKAFLFVTPEDSRYYYPAEFSEPWQFCWVTFAGAHTWFEDLRKRFGAVVELIEGGEVTEALEDVTRRFHERRMRDALHASELVYRLLVALERELATQQTSDPIDRAIELIRIHRDDPLSVKELADHYQLSREHFIRAFRSRHGVSPGVLIRQYRLARARRLVQTTRLPVYEVARQCGYADISSFGRAFTREFGTSPERMRG